MCNRIGRNEVLADSQQMACAGLKQTIFFSKSYCSLSIGLVDRSCFHILAFMVLLKCQALMRPLWLELEIYFEENYRTLLDMNFPASKLLLKDFSV